MIQTEIYLVQSDKLYSRQLYTIGNSNINKHKWSKFLQNTLWYKVDDGIKHILKSFCTRDFDFNKKNSHYLKFHIRMYFMKYLNTFLLFFCYRHKKLKLSLFLFDFFMGSCQSQGLYRPLRVRAKEGTWDKGRGYQKVERWLLILRLNWDRL